MLPTTNKNVKILYSKQMSKDKLFKNAKNEVKYLYLQIKHDENTNGDTSSATIEQKQDKLLNILLKLDNGKDKYFRILFLLSLYCTYFHQLKHKINIKKLNLELVSECYKKHNFVILDTSGIHKKIIEDISTYFNTDATNLEPITGKILYDLYKINFVLKKG